MQTLPNGTAGCGVVQWVVPTPVQKAKRPTPGRPPTNSSQHNEKQQQFPDHSSSSFNDSTYHSGSNLSSSNNGRDDPDESMVKYNNQTNSDQSERPFIDLTICRTICTFVEEHLKELREHQRLISQAKSKLVNFNNLQNNNLTTGQSDFIALNDYSKLKVRDEQTKAIETIKQLTNYLRELSHLQRLCDSASVPIEEEIVIKLSDLRSEIIQALNDFVLSNSDIDIPIIIDSEDLNQCEYDLCADAKVAPPTTETPLNHHQPDSSSQTVQVKGRGGAKGKKYSIRNEPTLVIVDEADDDDSNADNKNLQEVISSDAHIVSLEKRRREIQQLERETVELRQLFSDFFSLIKSQGEQVDKIEDNIVITTQRISEGQHNINKAMKSLTILMPVTGCMAGALIGGPLGVVVGGKLGGITIGCATSLLGLLSSYSAQRCITWNKVKDD